MVRLFVGGIPPNVSSVELEQRFATFGIVLSCKYAAPKPQGSPEFPPIPRGFAHVELEPKDDAAVAKCLSMVGQARHASPIQQSCDILLP